MSESILGRLTLGRSGLAQVEAAAEPEPVTPSGGSPWHGKWIKEPRPGDPPDDEDALYILLF